MSCTNDAVEGEGEGVGETGGEGDTGGDGGSEGKGEGEGEGDSVGLFGEGDATDDHNSAGVVAEVAGVARDAIKPFTSSSFCGIGRPIDVKTENTKSISVWFEAFCEGMLDGILRGDVGSDGVTESVCCGV